MGQRQVSAPVEGSCSIAHVCVDGKDIGYWWQHDPDINLTGQLGPLKDGQVASSARQAVIHAFKYSRAPAGEGSSSGGSIDVRWNHATYTDQPLVAFAAGRWTAVDIEVVDGKKDCIGALASKVGSAPNVMNWAMHTYSEGAELCRVTIRYNEAFGLSSNTFQ